MFKIFNEQYILKCLGLITVIPEILSGKLNEVVKWNYKKRN